MKAFPKCFYRVLHQNASLIYSIGTEDLPSTKHYENVRTSHLREGGERHMHRYLLWSQDPSPGAVGGILQLLHPLVTMRLWWWRGERQEALLKEIKLLCVPRAV